MNERITSTANPKIKALLLLQEKAAERRRQGLFVMEGRREIMMAMEAGFNIKTVYLCPELFGTGLTDAERTAFAQIKEQVEISRHVFEKLAYRDSSDGIIAVAEPKYSQFSCFDHVRDPLFIVLEAVEKPGNLGAVLRTADAAGITGVIICDPLADIYNPNTIRSSIGCVFTVPVLTCTSKDAIEWLKSQSIRIYAAALTAKKYYHETDMKAPLAIVMGTEATGLSDQWLKSADENILIPMSGKIDSLNVSVSTAILVFEAMRQRGFCKNRFSS